MDLSLPSWITTDTLISLLLVTSFACAGRLAEWASHSKQHWFVRTAVTFALLSPFILIPAYELFLTLVISVAVTCFLSFLARCYKARHFRRAAEFKTRPNRPAFSLASVMLLTATLAGALAAIVHVPTATWEIWPLWTITGFVLAVAFSLLTASVPKEGSTWPIRTLFVAAAWIAAAVCFIFCGGGLHAVTSESPLSTAFGLTPPNNYVFWSIVALIAVLLSAGSTLARRKLTALFRTAWQSKHRSRLRKDWWQVAALLVFMTALISLPALTIWELLHPFAIPDEALPNPNGIIELENFGATISQSNAIKIFTADSIDYDRLTEAVTAEENQYSRIVQLLELPSAIPTRYDDSYFNDMDKFSNRRQIARFLAAKSEVEIRSNRIENAINTQLTLLKLAEVLNRGGFAVDFLVATAVELTAYDHIYKAINLLNKPQCIVMQRELAAADQRRQPLNDVLYREHIFMQQQHGWFGHLTEFTDRISAQRTNGWSVDISVTTSYCRSQAIARLLMLKLALRAYQLDHVQPPIELNQLLPEYIAKLPADPFDPAGQPLRYEVKDNLPKLYSVGPDGDDDGGLHVPPPDGVFNTQGEDGDLCLDDLFADMNSSESSSEGAGHPASAAIGPGTDASD